jgi:nitrogen fixation/metabolism regulation signal transduction histidine kinase
MKIQTKLLVVVMFLSIICTAPAVVLYARSLAFNKTFSQIPQTVKNVADTAELNSISQFIRYYDEVLTQSARNYAFTGNVIWKNRYNDTVPKLDEKIQEALARGTPQDKLIFTNISKANTTLVAMETKAFILIDQNKKNEAQSILDSTDYTQQKAIYQNGLEEYFTNRGKGYNDTLTVSTKIVNDSVLISEQNLTTNRIITLLISFFCVAAGFTVYIFIQRYIFKPLGKVTEATKEITKGNLTYQIKSDKKDEIGELANSFDQMSKNLDESHKNTEQKVNERTSELTKLNKYMTDREIKMIELKKEIELLKGGRL